MRPQCAEPAAHVHAAIAGTDDHHSTELARRHGPVASTDGDVTIDPLQPHRTVAGPQLEPAGQIAGVDGTVCRSRFEIQRARNRDHHANARGTVHMQQKAPAIGVFRFDQHVTAGLGCLDLDHFRVYRRFSAPLDVEQDFVAIPRPQLDGAVEGPNRHVGTARQRDASLLANSDTLTIHSVHVDGAGGAGKCGRPKQAKGEVLHGSLDASAWFDVHPAGSGVCGQTWVPPTKVRTTRKSRSSTTTSACAPSAIRPSWPRPNWRAGVVEHMSTASITGCRNAVTRFRKARSIVNVLPASVPSSRNAASSRT